MSNEKMLFYNLYNVTFKCKSDAQQSKQILVK
jgi:hypothetical protein